MPIARVTRRQVLVGLTGATAVAGGAGLWLAAKRVRGWRFRNSVERGSAFAPNVFLAVEPTGDVVIWLVRAEMGQGVETALPLIVTEELDADWSRVRLERAVLDPRYDYGPMATVASASIQSMWTELRRAGATARHMLVAAAADLWDVPASELGTRDSTVTHEASGRSASYGELADRSAAERPPLRPRLKQPTEFRLIGRGVPRRDLPSKIAGTAVFGIDVRVANMQYAVIARSPMIGGQVSTLDDTATRAIGGVTGVVRVPSGVAVLGTNSHSALRGRDSLRVEWQAATAPISSDEISAALHAALSAGEAMIARDDGGSDAARRQPAHSAVYEVPYLAHAPMEPMNCVASVTRDRCEIWAPTQTPEDALRAAVRITGLPPERITVNTTYLGGGFGRRAAADFVTEAVDLSMRAGVPVQVLWSREDDMRHGLYRPAVAQELAATLDAAGLPSAWRHRVASVGADAATGIDGVALMGAETLPYSVGPMRVEWGGVQAPIPTTIWRSVGHSFTTFAIESFLDELAHSAGRDPVAYRLSLLPSGHRLRRCIDEAAAMSGWAQASAQGRALGVAAAECFGSYVALVVEVAQAADQPLRVLKVWCAADCGIVVHPDGATAQLEGGILFGLTAALLGRITVDRGRIVEGNFDSYRLLRIDETPDLEIRLVASSAPPGGVGELGVPTVAPAVANALFAAHGLRLRTLPLTLSS